MTTKTFWCIGHKPDEHAACPYDGMRNPTELGCSCECHNRKEKKMALNIDEIPIKVKGSITIPVEVELTLDEIRDGGDDTVLDLFDDEDFPNFVATSAEALNWLQLHKKDLTETAVQWLRDDIYAYVEPDFIEDNALANAEISIPSLRMKL